MTHLRKIMLEELEQRHYSKATTQRYICSVERFAQHFHCSPDRLGPAAYSGVPSPTLHRAEAVARLGDQPSVCPAVFLHPDAQEAVEHCDTPYPKKRHRLPTILSQEEIAQLIDAAPTAFYRTVLMTLYAIGVRNAELTHLKISDVDSQRMVIHVQDGMRTVIA